MKIYLKIFLITAIFIILLSVDYFVFAASDTINIFQQIIKGTPCNFNGICDQQWGETEWYCPTDCITSTPLPPAPPGVVIEENKTTPKSLIINDDNTYTDSQEVFLKISAENAIQMTISNDPDFKNGVWEEYNTSKKWTLLFGEGEKKVYAKFRSATGGTSRVVIDTIVLNFVPPANVMNFEAMPGDSKIDLKWQNPSDPDFKAVKIMRSTEFYPTSPDEGQLIYNNIGGYYVDLNVKNGVRYYYTAFTYDEAGNYSSGAVASATPKTTIPSKTGPTIPSELPPEIEQPIAPLVPTAPEIEKLVLENFEFWQGNKKLSLTEGGQIQVQDNLPLTISISYEKVPEVLKTIMITLEKPASSAGDNKKYFSFLLRIDKEKTNYSSLILPPTDSEIYPMTITVMDFKNQSLKKIQGGLNILKTKPLTASMPWQQKIKSYLYFIYIIIGMIILSIVRILKIKATNFKLQNPNF